MYGLKKRRNQRCNTDITARNISARMIDYSSPNVAFRLILNSSKGAPWFVADRLRRPG